MRGQNVESVCHTSSPQRVTAAGKAKYCAMAFIYNVCPTMGTDSSFALWLFWAAGHLTGSLRETTINDSGWIILVVPSQSKNLRSANAVYGCSFLLIQVVSVLYLER